PGSTGTYAGLSKDNLSVIGTGGNGGSLVMATGDGVSPVIIAAGAGEQMRITADSKVGIGTSTPANNLHVHDALANQDASIVLTNNLTGTNPLRGGRFRFLNSDLIIFNYEATGKIQFNTAFNTRMTIDALGNVGIGTTAPNHKLDIAQTGNNTTGINVTVANGYENTFGILVRNFNQTGLSFQPAIGLYAITGNGSVSFSPTSNYGVIGESKNSSNGIGVVGVSNSPSPGVFEAGILGLNFSTAASAYGIIGFSSGSSGAGTVGSTANATAGLLGYAYNTSTGPAIKSTSIAGSSQIGLELENGFIKVSGANRTVFQHQATAGNTSANETVIPNTTFANNATDLLIITPFWDGVYLNAPIGV
ncbi:MAG: hypothetical protein JNM19_17350, partial [Chitinophagaceae bacterium]|nr:hypothetical protein [Chitinophagaceae bacterium]